MPLTQANRPIAVMTPLGEDALLLRSFSASEQLGRPFQIELDLVAEKPDVSFDAIVGQNVTVGLRVAGNATRYFNGYVSRFSQSTAAGRATSYRATVVPWLWFLTRTADCRIFQDLSVPDIIKKVFRGHGFSDFAERLSGTYTPWKYCVQYRETDFNFVSRLMEHEGIYYYFTHENGRHTLVLADSPAAHDPYPKYGTIAYRPRTEGYSGDEEVNDWTVAREAQPGAFAVTDYDFEAPTKSLLAKSVVTRPDANAGFEVFDYPGEFDQYADAEAYARVRLQEFGAQYEVSTGRSDARGIAAGYTFTLDPAPRPALSKSYLVVASTCHASNDAYESGASAAAGGAGETFSCSFTAVDASTQYRPPRLTPKPLIQGPQTAIVVGKSGEEIWTDKYGRVKVQFHWDRHGKADETSSCWVRVAQVWAGNRWGAMFVPRIGQEVVVEFLEGDPDCPLITGRVYNGDTMPPYDLPANATTSTIKTLSSKGGGGFNELRFADEKGSEQVFLRAEKDHDVYVKHDTQEWVGNDRHLIVKRDQFEQVKGDKHLTVQGDQNEKVGGTVSLQAGQDLQQKVGMKHALDAGMEIHLKAGMNVVLEAGMSITLKAGGGFIVVGPAGVTISGTPVLINSGGAAGSGSGASPAAPTVPKEAERGEAGRKDVAPRPGRPPKPTQFSPQAVALKQAAASGAAFCETCG